MHAKRSRGWRWYVCCVVHVLGIRPRKVSSSPSLVSAPNFPLAPYQFLFIRESCNNSGRYNSRHTGEKSSHSGMENGSLGGEEEGVRL